MTFIEKFNLIIATLGCITGTIGFALSLYLTLLERPILKVLILSKQVFTLSPFYGEYSKTYCLIGIHVVITNLSKNPTSIYEITLNNKYLLNPSSKHTLQVFPINFYKKDNHLLSKSSYSYGVNSAKPIIRLEANETIDCCITFDQVPYDLINSTKLKLLFKASNVSKNISFKPNFVKFTVEE